MATPDDGSASDITDLSRQRQMEKRKSIQKMVTSTSQRMLSFAKKQDRFHDTEKMTEMGLNAMKATKYEKKFQSGMFDDME